MIVLRVCGAEKEQPRRRQVECWCGGLFCGRGGGRESKRFYADFHTKKTARSAAQFSDLILQADLFEGDSKAEQWREKLDQVRATNAGKARTRKPREKSAAVIPIASRRGAVSCRN